MFHSINPSDPHRRIAPGDVDSVADGKAAKTGKKAVKPTQAGDEVMLSQHARDVQTAKKNLGTMPADRAAHIKEIAASVQSGQYQVDAQAIARKMIEGQQEK